MSLVGDLPLYDVAIIGGGINGCGIARDAAGRGWNVFLCERGDLGCGTSGASTKLIHGGLRYLEKFKFRLVREALQEREVLWGIAPHIIWPLRFILPYHKQSRPAWLLQLGLIIYDHLGGRKRLPPTRRLQLQSDVVQSPLKSEFIRGFEYSDCWVDDARLVVLNARDAANHGATITTRTACVSAERRDGIWHVALRDEVTGQQWTIGARALVNAAGPWVAEVASAISSTNRDVTVRLVQGSHIVVPKLYDDDACYILQNADGRIVFVIPYEDDFTLIGTTDQDFAGNPGDARASTTEIDYLCRASSRYLRTLVSPDMVVWSYAGVRPLFDDGSTAPQQATRDYVLKLDAPSEAPALLSVLGGKITTYRRLAEAALVMLQPHLPAVIGQMAGWTGKQNLPGGDFPSDRFDAQVALAVTRFPFISQTTLRRLVRSYGTDIHTLLRGVTSHSDLGRTFGAGLTEAELRYLVHTEWAKTAEDVIWRRSKLGLRLSPGEILEIDSAMRQIIQEERAAGAVSVQPGSRTPL